MEPALFPPMIANVILILVGAISIVALIGVAYNYSIIISRRDRFDKIDQLERELKALQHDVREIKNSIAQYQVREVAPADKGGAEPAVDKPKAPPAENQLQSEVWGKFVADYNNLAKSMNVPRAQEACESFVKDYGLHLLICVESASLNDSGKTPEYAPVDKVDLSNYWAWNVTGLPDDFVVVPNPLHGYDEKLHNQGGMKVTFASNYETGQCREIQVKLPAHFSKRLGAWKIMQPGVIRLK